MKIVTTILQILKGREDLEYVEHMREIRIAVSIFKVSTAIFDDPSLPPEDSGGLHDLDDLVHIVDLLRDLPDLQDLQKLEGLNDLEHFKVIFQMAKIFKVLTNFKVWKNFKSMSVFSVVFRL